MDLITCKNVVKKFNDFTALNAVSLSIPKGQIFGLLGPNGAGKTTMIRILNQITMPDTGEVFFEGRPLDPNDIHSIGYLPEERGLYKKMKVGEQALYLARLKGMEKDLATKELKEWFVKFGIQAWWNKKVEELSKGMAQKMQFITTILHKPSLLILDEPFSGFDPVNVQLIRKEILELKKAGTTIILSTHNMESVEELCDNIALINKANLIIEGPLDKIRRDHGKNEIEVIYRSTDMYDFSNNALYKLTSQQESSSGYKAVLEVNNGVCSSDLLKSLIADIYIISYRELIPKMNDIFIKLVS